ncbi:YveK family protein [Nocardioides xinjiangensis]|uniref:hypothetical protein n=1 Tax=Nocardioides xinjiangensis TaxID=2817376 RepID=UPI001B30D2D5|nr:hypothetical protein [Nocardioides sp. SYSU D00778]
MAALRRWYVLLPLLGVTVLLVLTAGRGVQPEYDVTGATMLVPGRDVPDVPNPYGGPAEANAAVGIVLNSPEVRQAIADQGLVASYEVAPQSRSTVMNFQVRSDTPEAGIETGVAVFEQAAKELRDRQNAAGIRLSQQYSIDVLQAPSVSAAVTDGKLRNMAVVGVLGGALSLAIAVFFDDVVGLLRRRRRRRHESDRGHDPSRHSSKDSARGPAKDPVKGASERQAADHAVDVPSDQRPTHAAVAAATPPSADADADAPRLRRSKPERSPHGSDPEGQGRSAGQPRSMAASDAR